MVVCKWIYRTSFISILREVFSVGYQFLADKIVGTAKLDTESGYKFFNRRKIMPVLKKTEHPHWFWDTEVVVWSLKSGLTVKEMPVLFLRRFDKKSSVRIFQDVVDYMVSLWKLRQKL